MADVFALPAVGDTMVEGEIVEWFVGVGDVVELDQSICSIETDKSVVEMTTPFRGTVLQLGGRVGDVIAVGGPLIIVGDPGELIDDVAAAAPPSPADAGAAASVAPVGSAAPSAPVSPGQAWGPTSSPVVRRLAERHAVDLTRVAGSGVGGRVVRADVESAIDGGRPGAPTHSAPNGSGRTLAMPKARRLARELDLDLATVSGSGPRGSITVEDLTATAVGSAGADRREHLSAMRRSIGRHLTESVQTIPQFTSMVEVDASAVLATRKAVAQRIETPVPIDAVLMALMIPVLRAHPIMNATLDGDDVVYYGSFHIGVAVDTTDGLMLPVVRNADRLGIEQLASEIRRLANAARERTVQPDELNGATCTLNNVGALGVVAGTPILPLGTSAIVAFGVARPMVQLRGGNPVEVPTMTISATFDHRLIDGGDSGRFLGQLKQHLEVPALGLL